MYRNRVRIVNVKHKPMMDKMVQAKLMALSSGDAYVKLFEKKIKKKDLVYW